MGEKLLAQRLIRQLRESNGRSSRTGTALLEWVRDECDWLWPELTFTVADTQSDGGTTSAATDGQAAPDEELCWARLAELADAIDTREPEPALFACTDAVSDLLGFEGFERNVFRIAAAFDRLPRLAALRGRLFGTGQDLPGLVGRLAGENGSEAARRVRQSGPVDLGLLFVSSDNNGGGTDLGISWRFAQVIDAGLTDPAKLIDVLAGAPQRPRLALDDFAEQREAVQLLVRLLAGALDRGTAGINVLIYGPPGTGKTELARTLAAAVGVPLYAVGEANAEGEEPSRRQRLTSLRCAQRLLARRGASLLLFDELEDLFLETGSDGRGTTSKVFVNRILEQNGVPTLWTSNAIDQVDPAYLRRMSYILRLGYPSAIARARIVARVAEEEGVPEAGQVQDLLASREGTAGVARAALRAAAIAGGGAEDAVAVGRSLILGLRGGRVPAPEPSAAVDLSLYESESPIMMLVDGLAAPDAPTDFSLLLTGPPGTGKTALAAHVAERLGRPLLAKRASDLLAAWVGSTEANIAAAFAEARESGALLLFDEVDSLLLDRADAQRSWEISQVNELLTWMDAHPLPFVAATNYPRRLDPAALRRFVFKIELKALSPARAAEAWRLFFAGDPPPGLAHIGGLTPGDFAVVRRQLRYRGAAEPCLILSLLDAEARAKPEATERIGF